MKHHEISAFPAQSGLSLAGVPTPTTRGEKARSRILEIRQIIGSPPKRQQFVEPKSLPKPGCHDDTADFSKWVVQIDYKCLSAAKLLQKSKRLLAETTAATAYFPEGCEMPAHTPQMGTAQQSGYPQFGSFRQGLHPVCSARQGGLKAPTYRFLPGEIFPKRTRPWVLPSGPGRLGKELMKQGGLSCPLAPVKKLSLLAALKELQIQRPFSLLIHLDRLHSDTATPFFCVKAFSAILPAGLPMNQGKNRLLLSALRISFSFGVCHIHGDCRSSQSACLRRASGGQVLRRRTFRPSSSKKMIFVICFHPLPPHSASQDGLFLDDLSGAG